MNGVLRLVTIAVTVAACATPRPEAIRPGERIAVEIDPDRYGKPSKIDISDRNTGRGAGTGAASGAVVGALASLACGPFFFVCAAALGGAGAGVGALTGTVIGAATGLETGVRDALEARTEARARGDVLRGELVQAVRERLATRWDVVAGEAPTRLFVHLDTAALGVHGDGRVSLSVRATVTVERAGRDPRAPPEAHTYGYQGVAVHAAAWVEDRDGFLDQSLHEAFRHIATAVQQDLAH